MDEVKATPVLLSMLIMCLMHRKEGSGLPANLFELYSMALSGALSTARSGLERDISILQRVAYANMLAQQRREFTSDDVKEALGKNYSTWLSLAAEDESIPLIKTLEQATASSPAIYQFRHLSFQEALFVQHLVERGAANWPGWKDDSAGVLALGDRSLKNALRIGAGAI